MSYVDALPDHVDVVVLGTGLPESIIAAACARSGLSVLHLDKNDYYGGKWASFNLHTIYDWERRLKTERKSSEVTIDKTLMNEDEELVTLAEESEFADVCLKWHINDLVEQQDCLDSKVNLKKEIEEKWRIFSIDLLPKVLLARGEMVQLLCDSSVSKYCEFKCIERFLCCHNEDQAELEGQITKFDVVPYSRASIFQTNAISPLEKRRIMRFFSTLIEKNGKYEDVAEWKEFAGKPLDDLLIKQGITGKLKTYVADTIAILQANDTSEEGLNAVYRFLESLGRFGNSPFLWTLYGSGELSQCYCRLCAVYGGTYCLNRSIDGLVLAERRVVAVITNGQRINCKYVITDSSYLPQQYVQRGNKEKILRTTLLSNRSLLPDSDREYITLLNLKGLNPNLSARLLEVGYEGCVTPKNYYLSHIVASGDQSLSQLLSLVKSLYCENPDSKDEVDSRPPLLWSLSYTLATPKVLESSLPENLHVVPPIDATLDYSNVVRKTRELFEFVWADRDFLPPSLQKDNLDDDGEEETFLEEEIAELNAESSPVAEKTSKES